MNKQKILPTLKEMSKNNELIYKDDLFRIVKKKTNSKDKHSIYLLVDEMCKDGSLSKYDFDYYKISNVLPAFEKRNIDNYCRYFDDDSVSYDVSIWDTSWIAKYSHLIPNKRIVFFECYKYAVDHVFNKIRANGLNVVFYKDLKTIAKYMDDQIIYVVKTINEDSPIYRSKKKSDSVFCTQPKLEKMMVDFIADTFLEEIFSNEIVHIYKELIDKYCINYSTLMRYASKRNRKEQVSIALKMANPSLKLIHYD